MRKVYQFFILIICIFIFISCNVNPSKIDNKQAEGFANNITYVKDHKTGLCFALVASRQTGDTDQSGIGLAYVPCEFVKKYISN